MAPQKRKKNASQSNLEVGASNLHDIPIEQATSPEDQTLAQTAEREKQAKVQKAQLAKQKAAAATQGQEESEDDEPSQTTR